MVIGKFKLVCELSVMFYWITALESHTQTLDFCATSGDIWTNLITAEKKLLWIETTCRPMIAFYHIMYKDKISTWLSQKDCRSIRKFLFKQRFDTSYSNTF